MAKVNPLTYDFIQIQDIETRKIYSPDIKEKITAFEAANLAFFFSKLCTSGGFDWWGFVKEHKLEKHFKEVL